MGKYLNLVVISVAVIWGGVKKDLFDSLWINIPVSIIVLLILWSIIEITNDRYVFHKERET